MRTLVITLDGPAGSGKSTVARRLAQRLGLDFLDTGAMYRGIAAVCVEKGIDTAREPERVVELAQRMMVGFDWHEDPPRLHIRLDGVDHDYTDRLRDADVTTAVSDVAQISGVRQVLVKAQKRIGVEHPRLVTEGRDQGSVVFPAAQVKFYLDASPQVRATRRAVQLREAGKPADEAQILLQIMQRDRKDATRSDGPLICPPDAYLIDTSTMSLDEVVDLLERQVREKAAETLGSTPSPLGRGRG